MRPPLAAADLDPIFRERPAIHRFPGAMATLECTTSPCTSATNTTATPVASGATPPTLPSLRANLSALPGFGEMKIKALGSVLANRFGVVAARELVPPHPTLGDVDSPQALLDYQSAKRAHKAEWLKMTTRRSRTASGRWDASWASTTSRSRWVTSTTRSLGTDASSSSNCAAAPAPRMAFIDMGDQFIAVAAGRSQPPDDDRAFRTGRRR